MYVLDGAAYNHDYIGNVAWAAGMSDIGVPEFVALLGSEVQGSISRFSDGRFSLDDPLDSQAVIRGYNRTNPAFSGFMGAGSTVYPSKPSNGGMGRAYSK
jgi:hypothetical protein